MAAGEVKTRRPSGQVLLIDADDTLWETNLYYDRVLSGFTQLLAPLGYPEDYVRQQVDTTERNNIRLRGYGARNFLLTLEEVYLQLAGEPPLALTRLRAQIDELGQLLLATPPEIFDGVADTLGYLSERHRLLLFSKGETEEQSRKFSSSGLARYFHAWEIVPEKDETAYRALLERHQVAPRTAWMVGNSPRSDINPALAAGLNAVYIPSSHSWDYEQEELHRTGTGQLLILNRFRDLRNHF